MISFILAIFAIILNPLLIVCALISFIFIVYIIIAIVSVVVEGIKGLIDWLKGE